ncbi:MAG: RNA 2'-phosphotransferase [Chitinophagales bacterium]|nr:RNA 2'-phosphotransferase [Chitinophagales bacterium]
MNPKEIRRISKAMSLALRHRPEAFELKLDTQGWCNVDQLINNFNKKGYTLNIEILRKVVEQNDKKRFAFNETGNKIRANQGHSISIELGYQPSKPPSILFHGTATKYLASIQSQGLLKRQRHHVHLSPDYNTAVQVGSRHGTVVVLSIRAEDMYLAGHQFFLSENGVWLTDHVPTDYIR